MARILPFRGYRYDAEKVGDLAAVVSPPYDVISQEFRQELHRRHPCNVIRLILGEDHPGDDGTENRYLRARRYFHEWRTSGILLRDPEPVLYVYEQQYPWKRGEWRTRVGLIGAVQLEAYEAGVVFPHEQTMPGPKADRLRLMQVLPVNLEQIFCFYPGPSRSITDLLLPVTRTAPLCDFPDGAGVRHRLWVVQDSRAIADLGAAVRDRPLFIADGHHRYETALTFREEMRSADTSASPAKAYNFVMMNLVSIDDPGLTVLATHRLVRADGLRGGEAIRTRLEPYFRLEERSIGGGGGALQKHLEEMEERGRAERIFGLYAGGDVLALLTPKDPRVVERGGGPGRDRVVPVLDVVILDRFILPELLGVADVEQVGFTQDEEVAVREVREGRAAAAFLLNPTPVAQVVPVVTAGERLPPKTTYFYPKLPSGLVFLPVDPSEVVKVPPPAT